MNKEQLTKENLTSENLASDQRKDASENPGLNECSSNLDINAEKSKAYSFGVIPQGYSIIPFFFDIH